MNAPPTQPTLRRMREFGVRPDRELGQNFLIDSNILGVIERAAELDPADVVLEVGGGLGVLSEHIAPRVGHLHVVEVDPRLEAALRDAVDPFANVTLHLDDALALDLPALAPAPTKVVANLPYGVAATVLLKSVEELPGVATWVAMVQREVGERLAAEAGTSAYGATSALAQLSCEVRVLRRVARTVFHPVPRVDSVLVVMRRTAPPADGAVRASCTRRSRTGARRSPARSRSRQTRPPGYATARGKPWSRWVTPRTCAQSAYPPRTSGRSRRRWHGDRSARLACPGSQPVPLSRAASRRRQARSGVGGAVGVARRRRGARARCGRGA